MDFKVDSNSRILISILPVISILSVLAKQQAVHIRILHYHT